MKKNLICTFLITFVSCHCLGQLSAVNGNSDEFAKFKASKTYFLRTGNAEFDEALSQAMKDLWTVTPNEAIDNNGFKSKLPDNAASFILPVEVYNGEKPFHYLALINGGKKQLGKYSYPDLLAYCPLHHFGNEFKNTDCVYRVRNMIESMMQAMDIMQQKNIDGQGGLAKVYNAKAVKIKDRTLLFCDETLKPNLGPGRTFGAPNKSTVSAKYESMIAGKYPFKYEMCSKEKLEKVIKEKSTEYYYFQPAITTNKNIFVFDPSNGEVLYYEQHMQGIKITDDDIEDLVKTIKTGRN